MKEISLSFLVLLFLSAIKFCGKNDVKSIPRIGGLPEKGNFLSLPTNHLPYRRGLGLKSRRVIKVRGLGLVLPKRLDLLVR